jgi:hypothetical protein
MPLSGKFLEVSAAMATWLQLDDLPNRETCLVLDPCPKPQAQATASPSPRLCLGGAKCFDGFRRGPRKAMPWEAKAKRSWVGTVYDSDAGLCWVFQLLTVTDGD